MKITKELIHFLQMVGKPKTVLDVGCGNGRFVAYVSHLLSNCAVYGLDINREFLANGIAKGNFENAYPVRGDARKLVTKKSLYSLVCLKTEYYEQGFIDWAKLEDTRTITLSEFDLVTAFNPYNRLSTDEVNTLIKGDSINRNLITVNIVSAAAKCKGFVIYQREIAHKLSGIFGSETPETLSKEKINENLDILLKEGKKGHLEYISHAVTKDEEAANLIVLFQKKGAHIHAHN